MRALIQTRIANLLILGACLFVMVAHTAFASEHGDAAIKIATELTKSEPVTSYTDSEMGLRHKTMDVLMERIDEDPEHALVEFNRTKFSNDRQHRDIYAIFDLAYQLRSVDPQNFEKSDPYLQLKSYTSAKDWFVANRALIMLGSEAIVTGQNEIAISNAQLALALIPIDQEDEKTAEARYETSDLLHTIFIGEKDVEKAISSTQDLISIGIHHGRKLDKMAILHNLVSLFNSTGEPDVALNIAEKMVQYSDNVLKEPSLISYYNLGSVRSNLKQYQTAIAPLEKALSFNPGGKWEIAIRSHLSLSYAETGDINSAQKVLDETRQLISADKTISGSHFRNLDRAEALIALHNGDGERAFQKLSEWADEEISSKEAVLTNSRVDAANRLAVTQTLKNEKIARLEEQQKFQNTIVQRSMISALLATLMFISAGIAALVLYRNKKHLHVLNEELSYARDKALEGEKAKGNFLNMISHELRTPLNGIFGFAEIISRRTQDTETKSHIGMLQQSANRLFFMLKNIMIAADLDSVSHYTESCDIRSLFQTIVEPWNKTIGTKKIDLIAGVGKNIPERIVLDKNMLTIVIDNALANAIEYTPAGRIKVTLVSEDIGVKKLAVLKIEDTGLGMDAATLQNATEAFYQEDSSTTRGHEGAGLGLHAIHKLCKAAGADLSIKSELGTGTSITITFPLNAEPDEQAAPISQAA